jgi:hypothetical protein
MKRRVASALVSCSLSLIGSRSSAETKFKNYTEASDVPGNFREMIFELSLRIDKTELIGKEKVNDCEKAALSKAKQNLDADFLNAVGADLASGLVEVLGQLLPPVATANEIVTLVNAYINSDTDDVKKEVVEKAVQHIVDHALSEALTEEGKEKISDLYGKAGGKVYDDLKSWENVRYSGKSTFCVSRENEDSGIQAYWDKKHGKITITVVGDCDCKTVESNTMKSVDLADWLVDIEGKANLVLKEDGKAAWNAVPQSITVRANCCTNGKRMPSEKVRETVLSFVAAKAKPQTKIAPAPSKSGD